MKVDAHWHCEFEWRTYSSIEYRVSKNLVQMSICLIIACTVNNDNVNSHQNERS